MPKKTEEHRGPGADFETGRADQQHDEAAAGERSLSWGGEGGMGEAVRGENGGVEGGDEGRLEGGEGHKGRSDS